MNVIALLYVPHYYAELPHYQKTGFKSKEQLIKELRLL